MDNEFGRRPVLTRVHCNFDQTIGMSSFECRWCRPKPTNPTTMNVCPFAGPQTAIQTIVGSFCVSVPSPASAMPIRFHNHENKRQMGNCWTKVEAIVVFEESQAWTTCFPVVQSINYTCKKQKSFAFSDGVTHTNIRVLGFAHCKSGRKPFHKSIPTLCKRFAFVTNVPNVSLTRKNSIVVREMLLHYSKCAWVFKRSLPLLIRQKQIGSWNVRTIDLMAHLSQFCQRFCVFVFIFFHIVLNRVVVADTIGE